MKIRNLLALAAATLIWSANASAGETVTLTDIAGREVTVEVPVKHMILGEGRFLPSIGILDPENPVRWIAGMMGDFKSLDPASFAQYREKFPEIDDIPLVGRQNEETFSVEKAVTVEPDVAIFGMSGGHGPGSTSHEVLSVMGAADIPVAMIDFRAKPFENTPKSIRLLGKLMGKEEQAEAFVKFYEENLRKVTSRATETTEKPSVFLESRVGLAENCCEAMGNEMIGKFVTLAGGKNIFADTVPGVISQISVEQVIFTDPDVYITTAIGSSGLDAETNARRIVLGAKTNADQARASLARSMERTGLPLLSAVKNRKVYSVWHHIYNNPINVFALQAMAKWLHPDIYADLDPDAELATFFEHFQAVDLNGVYWIGLNDAPSP
ncbi:MAG: Fe3+-hydroxamate ABC transporter substrate-binding protein [Thalassospira sp.]|uniref:ABC transporter substrate-binding protein n=1 Tax=unclassified Thalassospira TaxID=2648997 RepID=UPI000C48D386|nr:MULTISPECIES: ABC transporter substrate-binding protein [unclassified Thalassospira]MBE70168.1 Fe3+-hydroxamate ABC transporter substrate-binding protein [Thalassospira sp.]QPO13223.1 ABC transporter substrate-binding protein [Thalassospira sp. A40-3]HAI32859.1 Fe3+-hydroxamate ABC transporter substrate-binding protein [Thalassospira sp.]|tara:strand:+ start:99 stop:1244 length:1146 start_codon:yes stop_codon:yes gene_type:complete